MVFDLAVSIGPRCWLFVHERVLTAVGFTAESDECLCSIGNCGFSGSSQVSV